jgi:creatinine amidohydrolase/Fe(II)-dependent formamide hydrolase-like protein
VDIFALDFTGQLDYPERPTHASELDTSLLLYVAPELVDMDLARRAPAATGRRRFRKRTPETESSGTEGGGPGAATREKGERLYKMIYERIATRVLESAA